MENKEWKLVDDSTEQYFKKIDEDRFLYKENRKCAVTGDVFVYESEMDLSDYNEDEIKGKISSYYDSLDQIKETYGDDWKQIVLECIFEQEESERELGFYEEEIFSLQSAVDSPDESNKSTGPKIG